MNISLKFLTKSIRHTRKHLKPKQTQQNFCKTIIKNQKYNYLNGTDLFAIVNTQNSNFPDMIAQRLNLIKGIDSYSIGDVVNTVNSYPKSINFTNWFIDEIKKTGTTRKLNSDLSIQELPKLLIYISKHNTSIAKKICSTKAFDSDVATEVIEMTESFPQSKSFVKWFIREISKSKEKRKINPDFLIGDLPSLLYGMKKDDITFAKKRCSKR